MGRSRHRRQLHSAADQAFGPGWTFTLPLEIDRGRDYIHIHLYAVKPSPVPDGWMAIWIAPDDVRARQSLESPDRDEVVRWARATGVEQILIEDPITRRLTILE